MAALGWLLNLGFAAGAPSTPLPDPDERRYRGASRKKEWWEDGFFLPPHTIRKPKAEREVLPHEPAIAAAKAKLRSVRTTDEYSSLAGRLGALSREANDLERRIERAITAEAVSEQYRTLGRKIMAYNAELDALKERRLARLRADDEKLLQLIMDMD